MEKKFNIVVGEDGTVKLPDAVLEKLEVKPGEEVRFEVDDNFYVNGGSPGFNAFGGDIHTIPCQTEQFP